VISLLDVNVLVALLVPEHEHHVVAQDWFAMEGAAQGWATSAVTELGAVRVCAQLPGGPWPPEKTVDRLLLLKAASRQYVWWPDVVSPMLLPEVRAAATAKQVTDRYLLGLGRKNAGRVATFDRALATFGGNSVVCLLRRDQG
jgi:uncharacterized protein